MRSHGSREPLRLPFGKDVTQVEVDAGDCIAARDRSGQTGRIPRMPTRLCLAATCHDPSGAFTSGVTQSGAVLRSVFSSVAIELLIAECAEDSIVNDVIWPLHAASRGRTVGYLAPDGLGYRFREDFGAIQDDRDHDIIEWIKRVEIAAQHASAMRTYVRESHERLDSR